MASPIIRSIEMENFGRIRSFSVNNLSSINLIIGENSSGKTFLLKSLYAALKTTEEYKRGDDIRTANDILSDKLRWTFQPEKIGDLVTKGSSEPLRMKLCADDSSMDFQFSKDASSKINNVNNTIDRTECNSVFIPAKEVLSLFSIILKTREIDRVYGFDDTYYDLVKALRLPPKRGKNYSVLAGSRDKIRKLVNGGVEFDETSNRWYYKSGNAKYSIGSTAEGIKKIAILDRLFANGYIGKKSVIFIDELESALHPKAISDFIDILHDITADEMGIQIFIASHSYFVIKKLYLVAMENREHIPCISMNKNGIAVDDLADGMPDNAIINESIRLYEEEVEKVL